MDVPPDYFEKLRRNATSLTRSATSNLDVVTAYVLETDSVQTYGYCHMPYYFPVSFFPVADGPRSPFAIQGPLEGAAAVHLAMLHLNSGDGSVVSDLQGLDQRCPLRFTFEMSDTELWETTAVTKVVEQIYRPSAPELPPKPCAFLGAGRSAVTMPMSIVTGVSGYAQMSGISTSAQLDDRTQYKHFARLIPSDDGTATALVHYLRDVIRTNHVAVILDNNLYSTTFFQSLLEAKARVAPHMSIRSIDIPFNDVKDQDLQVAVRFLKNTEYRYIFAIIEGPSVWERLMMEAHRQGIASSQYVWIYSDSLFPETITNREFDPDSPLVDAARGSSILEVKAGLEGAPVFSKFVKAFHDLQNHSDHIQYLQSKHPVYNDTDDDKFEPLQFSNIFQADNPGANAIFLYDATVAMGLAACEAVKDNFELDGESHYNQIINQTFTGASGDTFIDSETGTRDPSTAIFQLKNFVLQDKKSDNGKVLFKTIQTALAQNMTWTTHTPYIYGDGTTNMPPSLPVREVDQNYIQTGLRATGLAFAAVIMLLSIGFGLWTGWNRKTRIVCASQPIFLLFICFGVFLMGSALIPLSIDDAIASQAGCDIACMSAPWLFTLGYGFTFAGLVSKTWRINRIFHSGSMRRVTVTALDVMAPFAVLSLANVLILSIWSVVAPLEWVREISGQDQFGQVTETRGRCESDHMFPFVITLGLINFGALVVAALQAYQARAISLEFAESAYIARAIILFLLACFYGVPVLVITWDEPSARYFVLTALVVVCSLSVLLLIFIPKIYYLRSSAATKRPASAGRVHISGLEDSSCAGGSSNRQLGNENDRAGAQSSRTSADFSSEGVRILDGPNTRENLRRENMELQEQNALLEGRVKELETRGPWESEGFGPLE